MRSATPKRARQNREYSKRRAEFLETHPACQECGHRATEVHHRAGRSGDRLLNESRWSALCHSCHQWVTEHPAEAYESGLSERRHAVDLLQQRRGWEGN